MQTPVKRHAWDTDKSYDERVGWNNYIQTQIIMDVARAHDETLDERVSALRMRASEMRPVGLDHYAAYLRKFYAL